MSNIPSPIQMAKSIIVFGGAQVFSVLAALVRNKVAALMIGAAGVGLNGLFLTISSFISNVSNLGVSTGSIPSLSQSFESDSEAGFLRNVATVRKLTIITSIVGVLFTVFLSPLLSKAYFGDYSHIGSFVALAAVVVSTIVTNNEMSVLKAMHKNKFIVWQLSIASLLSIVIVVPFYIMWHIEGVIWALASSSIANMMISLLFSCRVCPFVLDCSGFRQFVSDVRPIINLGLAFVMAGLVSSSAELVIQSFFEAKSGLEVLGLYRAGYQISIVYMGMVFTAINNDFFPRLSAIADDRASMNAMVKRQIKVLLAMVVPLIALFEIVVPWIIPLLFSHEFDPIVNMVRWASLSVIAKSVYLPIGFMPLALKKSRHFFFLESISCILLVVAVIIGYIWGGCDGVGIGILLSNIADLFIVYTFCRIQYKFC